MKRVLIADDSPSMLKLLKKHVTACGYGVAGTAVDGREAVSLAKELAPDVVLMDIVMPGQPDGIDAAGEIREALDIPVIFITGYEDDEFIGRARDLGTDGYLRKPVKAGQLKAAVEIALGRKESERQFKDFFRDLIENTNDLVYVLDGKGNIKYINNRVSEKLGYSYEDILSKAFSDFVHPASFKHAAEIFTRQLKGEDVGPFELELIDRNGNARVIETREQLKWEGDRVVEVRGIGRDVTERKLAEEALRESEERYRSLFEHNPNAVYTFDLSGRFLSANRPTREVSGYDEERLLDMTYESLVTPDRIDETRDHFLKAAKGIIQRYESSIITADGQRVELDVTNTPVIVNGHIVGVYGIAEDITEKLRVQAALRESEEKFRSMVENINDIVITVEADGTITYISPAVRTISGYDPDEITGRNFTEFVHPDDLPDLLASFERSLGGVLEEAEFRIVAKDGVPRYVRSLSNVLTRDGGAVALTGVITDIDLRKRAEAALRESEEKYRDIFESAKEGIYQSTPDGRFLSVNPSFARILGYDTAEELMSATTDIARQVYVDPKRRAELQRLLSRQGEAHNFEIQMYRKDGSTTWVLADATLVSDPLGRPLRYQGAILDIGKRKEAEEALRQSEEKFRSLFESSRDVVYISTVGGKFLDINPAAEETFGYTRKELLALCVRDLYTDPEERKRFKKTVEERGFVKDYEVQMKKKDGTVIDCLITATVRRDPGGTIVGYQGIIRDVTERLRLRRQLIQTEKLSSLGEMISGVAHELNNPLTSIIGNTQLLMRKELLPDFRNKLEVIHRESVRCTRIVGGLLSFAREHKPERRMTDVNTVIIDSLRLREYDLRVNNIRVSTDLAGDIPETSADPYQLHQVFINLINNSHDALRENGGGTLSIHSFSGNGSIHVEFADDGPGIEPRDLNRIFDPFFTTKDIGKGTGLGLSIAYGIINEHGGTIEVESQPGKGTKFSVLIPLVESTRPEVAPEEIGGEPAARAGTVLVVEDEEPLRNMIIEALAIGGYLTEGARTGKQALSMIRKKEYDAVVSDMRIPGIGGKDLYTSIQQYRPSLADRVIFITGDVLSQDTLQFLTVTGNKFLEKPFDLDRLLHHVGEVVANGGSS